MFSHIMLGADDVAASKKFYDATLGAFGIAPGIMETPMLMGMPAEVQDALGKMVPFPSRMGKASEYAALVEHIFSNQYLNGEVIRMDGAIRMAAK